MMLTRTKHTANIPISIAPLQYAHASWLAIMIDANRDMITFLNIGFFAPPQMLIK
jgi:hypothetical protein